MNKRLSYLYSFLVLFFGIGIEFLIQSISPFVVLFLLMFFYEGGLLELSVALALGLIVVSIFYFLNKTFYKRINIYPERFREHFKASALLYFFLLILSIFDFFSTFDFFLFVLLFGLAVNAAFVLFNVLFNKGKHRLTRGQDVAVIAISIPMIYAALILYMTISAMLSSLI